MNGFQSCVWGQNLLNSQISKFALIFSIQNDWRPEIISKKHKSVCFLLLHNKVSDVKQHLFITSWLLWGSWVWAWLPRVSQGVSQGSSFIWSSKSSSRFFHVVGRIVSWGYSIKAVSSWRPLLVSCYVAFPIGS